MKRIIRIILIIGLIGTTIINSGAEVVRAIVNESSNPKIVLLKIRTSNATEIKNITTEPLLLNKEGIKYQALDSKIPLVVKNNVKIIARNTTLNNVSIEGNLYISANNVSLNNITVSGTVFLDPGQDGQAILNKVTAKDINIISGGEKGIYLYKVLSNNLSINSSERIKVDINYGSKIKTTSIISNAVIDSLYGTGGSIIVDGKNKKNLSVELRGNFKEVKAVNGAKVVTTNNSETKDKPSLVLPSKVEELPTEKEQLRGIGILRKEGLLEKLEKEKLTAQEKLITNISVSKNDTNTTAYLEIVTINDYNNRLIVANKDRSLPSNWRPSDLVPVKVPYRGRPEAAYMRKEASEALTRLFAKAKRDKINLYAVSGFRSYELQKSIYARNVAQNGEATASMQSAYPGKSEHQTGLAMDISCPALGYSLKQSFGNTREGKWLKENASEFGFIIRYPKGKEPITGYIYEPWHIRYVGREAAVEIMRRGITLEEYLGLKK